MFRARLAVRLVFMFCCSRGFLNPSSRFSSVLSRNKAMTTTTASAAAAASPDEAFPETRSLPPGRVPQRIHVIVLVHGWLGNPKELGYLHGRLTQLAEQMDNNIDNNNDFVMIHAARCNYQHTHDGVAAGGRRLAAEVNELLDTLPNHNNNTVVTLSFLGNSLGGLYARYALAEIPSIQNTVGGGDDCGTVVPKVFWTTCTPHLGVSEHTYLKLPRAAEFFIAQTMQQTGQDLFRFNNMLQYLVTQSRFWRPLTLFQMRLAHANAYATDFQVPTATAGFLVDDNSSIHLRQPQWETPAHVKLAVRTPVNLGLLLQETGVDDDDNDDTEKDAEDATKHTRLSAVDMARRLDAVGWVKVLCDVRSNMPTVLLPFGSAKDDENENQKHQPKTFTSRELKDQYAGRTKGQWHVPLGHTVLVANSKNSFYSNLNAAGKPYMDALADDLMRLILEDDDDDDSNHADGQ